MRKLIKKRTLSPNNVATETKRILREEGFLIPKGIKSRVVVNNKEYTLTTTGYKQDTPDARQYDTGTNGLVTLWLRDGNFYIFDRFDLNYGSTTREMGPDEFVQVITKMNFEQKYLLDNMRILTRDEYIKYVLNGLKDTEEKIQEILEYI